MEMEVGRFISQQEPEGKGKFVLKVSFGDISYEGDFLRGEPDGNGKEIIADQLEYEGGFSSGCRHGKGRMKTANGDVYEGEWKDGKPHGLVSFIAPTGL
eukprot:716761-Hanusia_phi.AAC.2